MDKKELLIIADYSQDTQLTLTELCEACSISPELARLLIAYEIIIPSRRLPEQYCFDLLQLRRLQSALRLQHDLDLNLAGIAIVLDLREEMEKLRAQVDLLEKHLLK